jgi:hypothetical protein
MDSPMLNRLSATNLGIPGALLLVILGMSSVLARMQATPSIEITTVPSWASDGPISGIVRGASSGGAYVVATYIHVEGSGWWAKPSQAAPAVPVEPDGTFTVDVAGGGLDAHATIFCVDLLPAGSSPRPASGTPSLPSNPQSVARHFAERYARTIEFAGHRWGVKSSPEPVGPGQNVFSHDPSAIWVDSEGQLHLTIQRHDDRWWSTEAILLESLGYGTYWFVTESEVEDLDVNATFGAFTWDAYGGGSIPGAPNREIDFEDSRWGNPEMATNSQAVVQPYSMPGNLKGYTLPDLSRNPTLTRFFKWSSGQVAFTTALGEHQPDSISQDTALFHWVYGQDEGAQVPVEGKERFRFNLWLNNVEIGGAPPPQPARTDRIEVVIRDFRFTPEPTTQLLTGESGSSSQWGSGWLNLPAPRDFAKGEQLRLRIGGSAEKILVRLLAKGMSPDSSRGLLGGTITVPEDRIVEVPIDIDRKSVIQISVHGGPNPWDKSLGQRNGPATLEAVELSAGPHD